jgi:hypothetical protein
LPLRADEDTMTTTESRCPVAHTREIRPELPELPPRMRKLHVDRRGYPVPWFVAWVNGEPDHRIMATEKMRLAMQAKLCMICGEPLGGNVAFVIGPMCAINRTSSEPPSHVECADYSARACPFLTRPNMRRRPLGEELEAIKKPPPGQMIERNPGATGVWVTKATAFRAWPAHRGGKGTLFDLGEKPSEVRWYCEGRPATRTEVQHSIDTGFHLLQAEASAQGAQAVIELGTRRALVEQKWMPA